MCTYQTQHLEKDFTCEAITRLLLSRDALYVIFSCLPVKKRLQLRRVCKLWRSIVDVRMNIPMFLIATRCETKPVFSADENVSTKAIVLCGYRVSEGGFDELLCLDSTNRFSPLLQISTAKREQKAASSQVSLASCFEQLDWTQCSVEMVSYRCGNLLLRASPERFFDLDGLAFQVTANSPLQTLNSKISSYDMGVNLADSFVLRDLRTGKETDTGIVKQPIDIYRFRQQFAILQRASRNTTGVLISSLGCTDEKILCVSYETLWVLPLIGTPFLYHWSEAHRLSETQLYLHNLLTHEQIDIHPFDKCRMDALFTVAKMRCHHFLLVLEQKRYPANGAQQHHYWLRIFDLQDGGVLLKELSFVSSISKWKQLLFDGENFILIPSATKEQRSGRPVSSIVKLCFSV